MDDFKFKTTKDIEVPTKVVDQVIGQDEGIEVIKKAARQKRNVVLIGEPGTGKSMLGLALAELMPLEELTDVLVFPNQKDDNNPIIKEVPAGRGTSLIEQTKARLLAGKQSSGWTTFIVILVVLTIVQFVIDWIVGSEKSEILQAADRISGTMFMLAIMVVLVLVFATSRLRMPMQQAINPKLLVDNKGKKKAPFIDATGAHEGALLGDIRHDPLQSGGLGTPAHERVVAGAIHKANRGVLFIDEIATLRPESQIDLLTAMQEKKFSITGRSERSSGAMTQTEPVPCDFVLVAAGNLDTIKNIHPALRSRIRGNGYEIYMNTEMDDTPENRMKLARFVAQEINKDKGKTPHFTKDAVNLIIHQAQKMAERKGKLTMRLRDLGGLIRVAGDIARDKGAELVDKEHIMLAVKSSGSLEQQLSDRYTKLKKEYDIIRVKGSEVGRVNGLAVLKAGKHALGSGIVMPIEAAVVPGLVKGKADIIATGKLGEIAKEAVQNVSAVFKKYSNKDFNKTDIHIQFIQAFEGVEGDSASISIATAVLSAIENIPVRQDVAMTGSLSIRGEVLPVGGVSTKVEAAAEAGIKEVILPKTNENDVLLNGLKIKITPVDNIVGVIENAFDWRGRNKDLIKKMKKEFK